MTKVDTLPIILCFQKLVLIQCIQLNLDLDNLEGDDEDVVLQLKIVALNKPSEWIHSP